MAGLLGQKLGGGVPNGRILHQRKRAALLLELFREAYGLSGHVVYADKPDVIVQDAEKLLGLRNKFISQRR
jgi:hypothetical protein